MHRHSEDCVSFPKASASLRSSPLRCDGSYLRVTNQVSDTRTCSASDSPRRRDPPSPQLPPCLPAPSGQTRHRCQCAKAALGFLTDEDHSQCAHLATEINNVKMKTCLHNSCSIDEWGPSLRLLLQIISLWAVQVGEKRHCSHVEMDVVWILSSAQDRDSKPPRLF